MFLKEQADNALNGIITEVIPPKLEMFGHWYISGDFRSAIQEICKGQGLRKTLFPQKSFFRGYISNIRADQGCLQEGYINKGEFLRAISSEFAGSLKRAIEEKYLEIVRE